MAGIDRVWSEDALDTLLSTPSAKLIEDMRQIEGDIMVLGAGGKMGPSLCLLIQNAIREAGVNKQLTAVSRFTDEFAVRLMEKNGIRTISCDMMEPGAIDKLPDCPNIIFLAGRKFGTDGQEALTWAMNSILPAKVAYRYRNARIVVFSSGNVYPMATLHSGGALETESPLPNGEYAMSCLARERAFQYHAQTYGTQIMIYRLSFAVDLRYGVLYDIASSILKEEPISLTMPAFNCIWQGDANEMAIRGLLRASTADTIYNVTGPAIVSMEYAATRLGQLLGKAPVLVDAPTETAYVANSAKAMQEFGYPLVDINTLLAWQAEWILTGGRSLNKPTHYETRNGKY